MNVYRGKVCGESLVATELAFSDGDEYVNNCAFSEFVNACNGVALYAVLVKIYFIVGLRFYVKIIFIGFFCRNPFCFCGGIFPKLLDDFLERYSMGKTFC
jgi:hypothetical protein